mgnify:CR=1 FL=1
MPRLWDQAKKNKFLFQHLKQIETRKPISVGALEPGMIVECIYDPEGKAAKPVRYVLMILNPLRFKKVHAISLGDINLAEWLRFYTETGIALNGTLKQKNVNMKCIYFPEGPKQFYNMTLGVKLAKLSALQGSYRTLWSTRFKRTMICDYAFEPVIIERDLPRLFLEEKAKTLGELEDERKVIDEQLKSMPPDRIMIY